MSAGVSLLDEVVEASGLMSLIAPFAISRMLISAGVTPRELTREDLDRVMPRLEQGLGVYLDEDQLAQALERLRGIAAARSR